jgi:uncharacterized membrane protein YfcA
MGAGEIAAILAAGLAAGAINAVVGSGSLITFPVLLAFGFPPLLANVSNNVGLVPGGAGGVFGYRAHLAGQAALLRVLGPVALAGALAGAAALLLLPPGAFAVVVPVLIVIACVLVVAQPWITARVQARTGGAERRPGPALVAGGFVAGAYGGYFGAAQGVLVFGLLAVFLGDNLQRVNAAKNVLVLIANGAAAVVFVIFTHIAWLAVLLLAVSSTAGGLIGARIGRRLPPHALRVFIVAVGLAAVVKLVFFAG